MVVSIVSSAHATRADLKDQTNMLAIQVGVVLNMHVVSTLPDAAGPLAKCFISQRFIPSRFPNGISETQTVFLIICMR